MNGESIAKLLYIVKKGREHYNRTLKECAKATGLTKQEVDILLFLENHASCNRACDIVNNRGLSKAYVSKALASLVKKGLVSIETEKDDRRYQHISLSKKSEKVISYVRQRGKDMIFSLTKEIPESDLHVFMQVIEKMVFNIEKEGYM